MSVREVRNDCGTSMKQTRNMNGTHEDLYKTTTHHTRTIYDTYAISSSSNSSSSNRSTHTRQKRGSSSSSRGTDNKDRNCSIISRSSRSNRVITLLL
eukprot:1254367-Pyramimonas_sp.AAC.1